MRACARGDVGVAADGPLAVTQVLLDVARNDLDRDNDELVDRLHVVNAPTIDLTEALLLLSRADQRVFNREPVDLSLIAEEATETLLPFAEARGVTIETSGDVALTIGSRAAAADGHEPRAQRDRPRPAATRHPCVTTSVHPKSAVLTVENTREKVARS